MLQAKKAKKSDAVGDKLDSLLELQRQDMAASELQWQSMTAMMERQHAERMAASDRQHMERLAVLKELFK